MFNSQYHTVQFYKSWDIVKIQRARHSSGVFGGVRNDLLLMPAGICCFLRVPALRRSAATNRRTFTKNLSQFSEISFKFPTNNGAFSFYPCMVTIQNEILPTLKQHRCKHTVKWWKLTFKQSTNNFYPYFLLSIVCSLGSFPTVISSQRVIFHFSVHSTVKIIFFCLLLKHLSLIHTFMPRSYIH